MNACMCGNCSPDSRFPPSRRRRSILKAQFSSVIAKVVKAAAGTGPLLVWLRADPMVGALRSWAGAGGAHPCAGRSHRQD